MVSQKWLELKLFKVIKSIDNNINEQLNGLFICTEAYVWCIYDLIVFALSQCKVYVVVYTVHRASYCFKYEVQYL